VRRSQVPGACLWMESVGSVWAAGRDLGPVDPFGFSWPPAVLALKARPIRLDCLGFAWILLRESRLFNGLRGLKRESFFLSPFP
jgi:hypothetical protein